VARGESAYADGSVATAPAEASRRRSDERIEIAVAVILSIGALLTAWAGYQAAVWGGVQSEAYARGDALRTAAGRAAIQAGQLEGIDVYVFSQWLNATAAGNAPLAKLYSNRFRSEFKPAFSAWLATDPLTNPGAPPSPFAMPQYQRAAERQADQLNQQADASFAAGDRAHRNVDTYVKVTVFLATAMFFGGICQVFRIANVRLVLLAIAAAACLLGVVRLVGLPVDRVSL